MPDETLGAQSSTVQTTGLRDTVLGGQRVGDNLFHSFLEFNVGVGRSLYFADPGVANILTRVTGNNPSTINGRLGVDGTANLFLLNPNGIIFGPGASLDVRGSFTASTANGIQFSDGNLFSVTQPIPSNLLTISVPVGLQRGGNQPTATLINRGNLATGQDLTLDANTLNLQGQLQAERHLTLQATDTVTIRDTVTEPFLARSGGATTIQGDRAIDILTLNHLSQTPFASGGPLTLISDGNISADAHFDSQGFFLLKRNGQPGDFVSLFDPIIRANGDVVFGNYTGVSLKVEATGSIQGGDIVITGPDLTIPIGDPDVGLLAFNQAVILRAGLPFVPSPNLPQTTGGTPFTAGVAAPGQPPGSIVVGNIDTSDSFGGNGGVIQLSAPGTITTGALDAYGFSNFGFAGDGGSVSVVAGGDLTINGPVSAYSDSRVFDAGNGGLIRLTSTRGRITTGDLSTYSYGFENANEGGLVTVTANDAITINGTVSAASIADTFDAGNSGAIALTSTTSTITTGSLLAYSLGEANAGNGGNVSVTAGNTILSNGAVNTASQGSTAASANGGAIALTANTGDIIANGDLFSFTSGATSTGNGGAINLTTTTGNIVTNRTLFSSAEAFDPGSTTGNGGAIAIASRTGNLTLNQDVNSYSYGDGNSGDGGAITLTTVTGNITTNNADLNSYSASDNGNSATGGKITLLTALGNIALNSFLDSDAYADQGNAGNGGEILVSAPNGQVIGSPGTRLTSYALSVNGSSGNGGAVTVEAKDRMTQFDIVTLSSTAQSGSVQLSGFGDLTLENVQVLTTKQVELPLCRTCPPITVNVGDRGKSGDVNVNSSGNLTFNNSVIDSEAKGAEPAGNIAIASRGQLTFNNSQISSNTSGAGQAGNISAIANQGMTLNSGSTLSAQTRAQGNAGSISIRTPQLLVNQGAKIATTTTGSGQAGSIQIQTTATTISGDGSGIISGSGTPSERGGNRGSGGNISFTTDNLDVTQNGIISTSTFTQGQSGNIDVNARSLTLATGGALSATTQNQGSAGSIRVNASDQVNISDQGSILVSTTREATGNGGNVSVTTRSLNLSNSGKISADSQGTGQGGDVNVTADQITLRNRGQIIAETAGSNGGNINLNIKNLLLMRENSLISASAGTAQSGGNGGNVTIQAGFVVASLKENSDIRANAFTGDGGRVNITAKGIFGLRFQPQDTPFSDITASSNFGTSGTVTLTTLNVDPNRGLVQLPTKFSDSTNQIIEACSPNRRGNSFVITGRGGVALNPGEVVNQGDLWRGDTETQTRDNRQKPGVATGERHPGPSDFAATLPPAPSLVEATQWHRNPDGSIALVAVSQAGDRTITTVSCPITATQENR
jgi:filamentous hemagglutinin family protein